MVEESLIDLTKAKKLRKECRFKEAMAAVDKVEEDLVERRESGEIKESPYLLELLRIENFRISVDLRIMIERIEQANRQ